MGVGGRYIAALAPRRWVVYSVLFLSSPTLAFVSRLLSILFFCYSGILVFVVETESGHSSCDCCPAYPVAPSPRPHTARARPRDATMPSPESLHAALPSKEVGTDAHDEEELANFGYKQELNRDWGLMHNFGISFSIIVCSFPSPRDLRDCPKTDS